MRITLSAGLCVILLSGCANQAVSPSVSVDTTRQTAYGAEIPGEVYIAMLRAKKRQMLARMAQEEQGMEYADDATQALALNESSPRNCDKVATGKWADSVRYGQTFLAYENYVNTVSRCLEN